MRAVVDTNVLVAALLSRGGSPAQVLRGWLHGDFELLVSAKLLAELERVLAYPKISTRVTPAEAQEFLDLLHTCAVNLDDPPGPPRSVSRDNADDYLIALAESAHAVIVTGDDDLLQLAETIPVHSPAGFLRLLA